MYIIGENIHIISDKVKAALSERDAKFFQELAVKQVEAGAQVLDLNLGPRSIITDKTNRYVYVPHLGTDQIFQFRFDAKTGMLTANTPPLLQLKAGHGPRHIIISGDNRFVYVLTEMTAVVITLSLDRKTGLLTQVSEASALPPDSKLQPGAPRVPAGQGETPRDTSNDIWASDLHLTPDGQFLYAAERTSSTINALSVEAPTGRLTYLASPPTEKQPRGFRIGPRHRQADCQRRHHDEHPDRRREYRGPVAEVAPGQGGQPHAAETQRNDAHQVVERRHTGRLGLERHHAALQVLNRRRIRARPAVDARRLAGEVEQHAHPDIGDGDVHDHHHPEHALGRSQDLREGHHVGAAADPAAAQGGHALPGVGRHVAREQPQRDGSAEDHAGRARQHHDHGVGAQPHDARQVEGEDEPREVKISPSASDFRKMKELSEEIGLKNCQMVSKKSSELEGATCEFMLREFQRDMK